MKYVRLAAAGKISCILKECQYYAPAYTPVYRQTQGGFTLTWLWPPLLENIVYIGFIRKKGKFGFFQSEEEAYLHSGELGINENPEDANKYVRYPLVYLVGLTDICYPDQRMRDACKLHI